MALLYKFLFRVSKFIIELKGNYFYQSSGMFRIEKKELLDIIYGLEAIKINGQEAVIAMGCGPDKLLVNMHSKHLFSVAADIGFIDREGTGVLLGFSLPIYVKNDASFFDIHSKVNFAF